MIQLSILNHTTLGAIFGLEIHIIAYLADRLDHIERSPYPHLCRWTNLDRLMIRWAVQRTESHGEGLPASIEYLDALTDLWCALKPFLVEFAEYRTVGQLSAAVEASWLWDDLLGKADELMRLEKALKE